MPKALPRSAADDVVGAARRQSSLAHVGAFRLAEQCRCWLNEGRMWISRACAICMPAAPRATGD